MTLNTVLKNLHPIMRQKVQNLITHLTQKNVPITLVEGYRTPVQQKELHDQGAPEKPWMSLFQYGVACKFELSVTNDSAQGENADNSNYWGQFTEFAKAEGLETSDSDKSQLQLPNMNVKTLIKGQYPEGGDESWANNLELHITYWTDYPKPPVPRMGDEPISHLSERDEKSTQ
ncbi:MULTISPECIES: hypothetical protein [Aliiglaciecola]|uniref:hypothetical protein n=1 Tax=Aliiglaciecola TaxID=1406885 RepID=UPI001C095F1A|nr:MULTISPECIES: hypothetical protein [Aliiglaciecola]MBU2876977.1 hypothetical protein [Aliiglaciecola lipolytica]MDO6712328.1 hypothetical protein [Aliiglaciecola sp. 2_MG-2023]MDO6753266.1 hypothetical protein [Aliiglaciecola sp. 1_MG-2023]